MNKLNITDDLSRDLCQLVTLASRSNAVEAMKAGRKLIPLIKGMDGVVDGIEQNLMEADHAMQGVRRQLDDYDNLHDAKTER